MNGLMRVLAAATIVAAPTAAIASSATVRLVLTVPVQCTVNLLDGFVQDNRVTLQVQRGCNTGHDIVLYGNLDDDVGDVTLSFNGSSYEVVGGYVIVPQPEGYYDQVDTIVLETSSENPFDVEMIAASLQVSVVV